MRPVAAFSAGIAVAAGLAASFVLSPAAAADETLRLTAGTHDTGWIALAVSGPDRTAVEVHEQRDGRSRLVARLFTRGGRGELVRGVPWRCEQRSRRFVATAIDPAGGARTAVATIVTPSCARRLRMIVASAQLRPGQAAVVRVTDSWHQGGVSARLCARPRAAPPRCRIVRLARGAVTRRAQLRLKRAGRWTIELRSAHGQRLRREIDVRRDARLRVLVTGDSMIFGLFESLARDLDGRGTVQGDPHPGRGITTPGFLDWPGHARRSARDYRPDVTVVFLGAADAGYPLNTPTGETVACCEPAWVAAYAALVRGMMASYLRDGRSLVYWVLLPAPRSEAKARVFRAQNDAIRQAAAGYADGVSAIGRLAEVIAPDGAFHESIVVDGRREVVRDEDGVHLSAPGIRIATDVLTSALRRDGLLR